MKQLILGVAGWISSSSCAGVPCLLAEVMKSDDTHSTEKNAYIRAKNEIIIACAGSRTNTHTPDHRNKVMRQRK